MSVCLMAASLAAHNTWPASNKRTQRCCHWLERSAAEADNGHVAPYNTVRRGPTLQSSATQAVRPRNRESDVLQRARGRRYAAALS